MIRKGQARWVGRTNVRRQIQFIQKLFDCPPKNVTWESSLVQSRACHQSCNTFVLCPHREGGALGALSVAGRGPTFLREKQRKR
jgi:hypothetical protein